MSFLTPKLESNRSYASLLFFCFVLIFFTISFIVKDFSFENTNLLIVIVFFSIIFGSILYSLGIINFIDKLLARFYFKNDYWVKENIKILELGNEFHEIFDKITSEFLLGISLSLGAFYLYLNKHLYQPFLKNEITLFLDIIFSIIFIIGLVIIRNSINKGKKKYSNIIDLIFFYKIRSYPRNIKWVTDTLSKIQPIIENNIWRALHFELKYSLYDGLINKLSDYRKNIEKFIKDYTTDDLSLNSDSFSNIFLDESILSSFGYSRNSTNQFTNFKHEGINVAKILFNSSEQEILLPTFDNLEKLYGNIQLFEYLIFDIFRTVVYVSFIKGLFRKDIRVTKESIESEIIVKSHQFGGKYHNVVSLAVVKNFLNLISNDEFTKEKNQEIEVSIDNLTYLVESETIIELSQLVKEKNIDFFIDISKGDLKADKLLSIKKDLTKHKKYILEKIQNIDLDVIKDVVANKNLYEIIKFLYQQKRNDCDNFLEKTATIEDYISKFLFELPFEEKYVWSVSNLKYVKKTI